MRNGLCRLTVQHDRDDGFHEVDLAVPCGIRLCQLMPSIVDLAHGAIAAETGIRWRLVRIDGVPLDESMTLEQNDIHDGAMLLLTAAAPPAPVCARSAATAATAATATTPTAVTKREVVGVSGHPSAAADSAAAERAPVTGSRVEGSPDSVSWAAVGRPGAHRRHGGVGVERDGGDVRRHNRIPVSAAIAPCARSTIDGIS
ncbi:EsaB/YukD family protein [Mycolicibacterium elephantis]|uniref:EsaB/YukD family protein n=1 Tax=Mycolicibacterium elephantis TaxID=81858 RepID=UPI0013F4D5D7|nr:EsaB/YukD family protein [Mycolicibacterium elephantis]